MSTSTRQLFNVWAGDMYCGKLEVQHCYHPIAKRQYQYHRFVSASPSPITLPELGLHSKVVSYCRLNLVRVGTGTSWN